MKKKTIRIIIIVVTIIAVLFILLKPKVLRYKDGGTVEYKAVLYKYTKIHRLSMESSTGFIDGWELEIFGIKVGGKINEHLNNVSFKAKILEINNNVLLVEVTEKTDQFNKGDQVKVKTSSNPTQSIIFEEGMNIEIIFNGNILESYPPQISASSINNLEPTVSSIEMISKNVTSEGATFTIINYTNKEYWYGQEYVIEKNENGNWKEIDTITGEPLTWNAIAYTLKANETKEININWELAYGKLASGKYRLVKYFIKEEDIPIEESEKEYIYAEFTV